MTYGKALLKIEDENSDKKKGRHADKKSNDKANDGAQKKIDFRQDFFWNEGALLSCWA